MLVIISDVTYKGHGLKEDYEQLIPFLDEVFFTDDDPATRRDFLNLLPKLYKPENAPCYSNFVVKEGESIKGSVGLFYNTVKAGGETLRCGGIGNVAVHCDSRSKGYMIDCMNMAMNDMIESKADFGLLGGQRQRYAYFSFEPAGIRYDFTVTLSNLRHCFGSNAESGLEVRRLTPDDTEVLAQIDKILTKEPYYAIHPPEKMFDILCSWRCKPYVAFQDGVLKGFFTRGFDGSLADFKAVDAASIDQLILAVFETVQDRRIEITVAPYDTACIDRLTEIAETYYTRHAECYTVINYENTIRGLLKVKAAIEPISDGLINLLIHGYAGDENLEVSVNDGHVNVRKTENIPDIELGHHQAIRFLLGVSSAERRSLAMDEKHWFPLPLHCYGFDSV